jgi:hypothetical protein
VTFFSSLNLKVKSILKGTSFDDVETIEQNAAEQLFLIPETEFEMCFQCWQEQWNNCIHAEQAYFADCTVSKFSRTQSRYVLIKPQMVNNFFKIQILVHFNM